MASNQLATAVHEREPAVSLNQAAGAREKGLEYFEPDQSAAQDCAQPGHDCQPLLLRQTGLDLGKTWGSSHSCRFLDVGIGCSLASHYDLRQCPALASCWLLP